MKRQIEEGKGTENTRSVEKKRTDKEGEQGPNEKQNRHKTRKEVQKEER